MNEAMKVILNRRSIRAFRKNQITDAELKDILNAAIMAPVGLNPDVWHFTVIQNREMLDKMVRSIKEAISKSGSKFLIERASYPEYHTFYNAPTVILVSGDSATPGAQSNCGAAVQNILLAAESLNIGSCWIQSSNLLFNSDMEKELRKELGIPDGFNPVCSIAIGYKAIENPSAPPRNKDVFNFVK